MPEAPAAAAATPETSAIHAVAGALWLWDTLALDLGDIAVVTEGHRSSRLVALVASWYGAMPLIVTSDLSRASMPGTFLADGSLDAAKALAARLQERPAVAGAELSGRAELVDLLLEAVPPSSRLMLAGAARERLTIDYYVNVHRKGLRLVSGVLDAAPLDERRLDRARRLLARPERLAASLAALGEGR